MNSFTISALHGLKTSPFNISVMQCPNINPHLLVLYYIVSNKNPFTISALQCLKTILVLVLHYNVSTTKTFTICNAMIQTNPFTSSILQRLKQNSFSTSVLQCPKQNPSIISALQCLQTKILLLVLYYNVPIQIPLVVLYYKVLKKTFTSSVIQCVLKHEYLYYFCTTLSQNKSL